MMKIEQIEMLNTTLVIDPDEARILAAACRISTSKHSTPRLLRPR